MPKPNLQPRFDSLTLKSRHSFRGRRLAAHASEGLEVSLARWRSAGREIRLAHLLPSVG